jgi:hypothetical protein
MSATTAFCPHCLTPLGSFALPYPVPASRCPQCRLLIGTGRARASTEGAENGRSAQGTAAGMLVAAARRADGEIVEHALVAAALERVADDLGCTLQRLRMIDYNVAAETDNELPSLAAITATFGGWKNARRAAAGAQAKSTRV